MDPHSLQGTDHITNYTPLHTVPNSFMRLHDKQHSSTCSEVVDNRILGDARHLACIEEHAELIHVEGRAARLVDS